MEDVVNQLLALLTGVNPLWGGLAVIVVYFLRQKGWLKVKWPLVGPSPTPDIDDPLSDNALLKRLLDRLRLRFAERVLDDGEDDDDVYADLLDRIRFDPVPPEEKADPGSGI